MIDEELSVTYQDVIHQLWYDGDLSYLLWDQQVQIYERIKSFPPHVRTIVLLIARQYGKSVLGADLYLEDCLQNDNVAVLVVAPELKQTKAIVNPRITLLAQDAPPGLVEYKTSEATWKVGNSEIILGGFDVKNATRQRGKTLHKIYIEEIVDSNPDQYLESIRSDLGPALTHSKNAQMVFLTTPPKIPDHPFITHTMPLAALHNALFIYTIDDNKMITPEQYQACVELCGGIDTIEFKREYLCQIVRDPTIVVTPHFNDMMHIREFGFPLDIQWQITLDWGGVKDKTHALLHFYDFYTDTYFIWDERSWPPNTSTGKIVDEAIQMEKDWNLFPLKTRYADVPGQVMVDLHQEYKYPVALPPKSDWSNHVKYMDTRFARNKTIIHPRCKVLILTCRSGTFNKQRTDFERTEALGHCDALACLMYAIRTANAGRKPLPAQGPFSQGQMNPNAFRSQVREDDLREKMHRKAFEISQKRFGKYK